MGVTDEAWYTNHKNSPKFGLYTKTTRFAYEPFKLERLKRIVCI